MIGTDLSPDPKMDRALQFLNNLNDLTLEAGREGMNDDFLQRLLESGMDAVDGHRGFFALVQHETGELNLAAVAGPDWTDEKRSMRLNLGNDEIRGISGHVVLTGEPYVSDNVTQDRHYLEMFDDVKSEVLVPVVSNSSQTIGVINIESSIEGHFSEESSAILTAFAQVASLALTVQGFRARETALIEIGKTLSGLLDISKMCAKVVDVASIALKYEDCSIFLVDDPSESLILRSSRGKLSGQVGLPAYKVGEGLTGWVAKHGKAIRLEAPQDDARWLGLVNEFSDEDIGPFLAVPIMTRNKVLGVLRALRRKSHAKWFSNRFTEVDERVLVTIAGQIGVCMENASNVDRLLTSQRMSAWGELSARSAHMIGNRAFALKGDVNELGYLIAELPEIVNVEPFLEVQKNLNIGIERLEEILREFRDFVMSAQTQSQMEDLNALVMEIVKEMVPKRTGVEVQTDFSDSLPAIPLDSRKLRRAFGELFENAVSYQPDGGYLRVSTRILESDETVGDSFVGAGQFALVEIEDGGPGVPYENKERIFQPFFTSRTKGMGLGLSIVRGVIESHHGYLREIGEPGSGAKFQVFLPV